MFKGHDKGTIENKWAESYSLLSAQWFGVGSDQQKGTNIIYFNLYLYCHEGKWVNINYDAELKCEENDWVQSSVANKWSVNFRGKILIP